MNDWDGAKIKPCSCGADNWEYLYDVEHDGGDCEVYKCQACKRTIHIELPD